MNSKLSGVKGRKRKAKQKEEAQKSSKLLAAFRIKKPTQEGLEQEESNSQQLHENQNDSDEEEEVYAEFEEHYSDSADTDASLESSSTKSTSQQEMNVSDHDPQPEASQEQDQPAVLVFMDVGYVNFTASGTACIGQITKERMIKKGAHAFRHDDVVLPKVLCGTKCVSRGMTKNWFIKTLPNGEQVPRTWLIYSPYKEAAFCFSCLLFPYSPSNAKSAFESPNGFRNWKKVEKLNNHEKNYYHRKSFLEWKEMERILKMRGVDEVLQKQIQDEKLRWREILKRIIDAIKFLSSQNLALRGHIEKLDSANPGNFLATLKFLATYDDVMSCHLTNVRENPRSVSYLSHDIQNEFISLLGNTVRKKILKDIKNAKYFGILLDSTPDVSHTEQLSEVIRYVRLDYETGDVAVREVFIKFVELDKKGAAGYEEIILNELQKDDLDFRDCRAQMYDNAAVMLGRISGLQTRLRERNAKAVFINCDNHSLNLACVHAASVNATIITFFGTVQQVYVFFSGSTGRWKKMSEKLKVTLKKESDTRWSAREAAVRVIAKSYTELIHLLQSLNEDELESADTRANAGSLIKCLLTFDFVCYMYFWEQILRKINVVQKRFQSPNMNLQEAASDLHSLKQSLSDQREDLCKSSLQKGLEIAETWGIATERRIRRGSC